VPHQVDDISLGLKVIWEHQQILYSGDSAWTDLFRKHASGVDLFLCECSFYDHEAANHLNYLKLQTELPGLSCKKVVLTHMGEEVLARSRELVLTLAEDGMVIEN
jgi:ribonuclease BN (tRNA processing enzyme)